MNESAELRSRLRKVGALVMALGILAATTSSALAAPNGDIAPDLTIVGPRSELTPTQVRSHDITTKDRGREALTAAGGDMNVNRRAHRVYKFGARTLVVAATSPVRAWVGLNRAGDRVFELAPETVAATVVSRAGFVVPPTSAWAYNNDGSFSDTVGTWKRTGFWTLTKANNYKTNSTATAYDYWRVTVKLQAATLTGAGSNEGFNRAWVEMDFSPGSTTGRNYFELGLPEESYGGVANQTVTVGFGSTFTFNLGVAPLTAGGSTNTTYGGSMTRSSENWHPVVRSEAGSGGVQWCRYVSDNTEFTGTKTISARESMRVGATSSAPTWSFLWGMQDHLGSCPSQI